MIAVLVRVLTLLSRAIDWCSFHLDHLATQLCYRRGHAYDDRAGDAEYARCSCGGRFVRRDAVRKELHPDGRPRERDPARGDEDGVVYLDDGDFAYLRSCSPECGIDLHDQCHRAAAGAVCGCRCHAKGASS